jgi:glutamate formiminotransferase
MLECVVNISEGRDASVLDAVAAAAGAALLDVHTDPHHHRSVLTLAGPEVEEAARGVAAEAVARIDLRRHQGVHPRLGAVDVVPFVPLDGSTMEDAVAARGRFARWAGDELALPCFLYGPERSLPDVRRGAFGSLAPDTGPALPHPTAGAVAVGARPVLVAYNLWLAPTDPAATARAVAGRVRGPALRSLGLDVGGRAQVSCNLVDPGTVGPADAYDAVARCAAELGTSVVGTELVGLLPSVVLHAVPPQRWAALDLAPSRTIEARLEQAGLGGSSRSGSRQ